LSETLPPDDITISADNSTQGADDFPSIIEPTPKETVNLGSVIITILKLLLADVVLIGIILIIITITLTSGSTGILSIIGNGLCSLIGIGFFGGLKIMVECTTPSALAYENINNFDIKTILKSYLVIRACSHNS